MLDLQRYTRQELIDIFKTQRLDSIKDKLKRKGYKFTTDGRGDSFTLTITELPLRFHNFCTDELNFAPQTDFVKLKRIYIVLYLMKTFDTCLTRVWQD